MLDKLQAAIKKQNPLQRAKVVGPNANKLASTLDTVASTAESASANLNGMTLSGAGSGTLGNVAAPTAVSGGKKGKAVSGQSQYTAGQAGAGYDPTKAQKLIDVAMSMKGIPYVAGGRTRKSGLDCSAFTSLALKEAFGINVVAYSGTQVQDKRGIKIPTAGNNNLANAKPGDLLFFDLAARNAGLGVDHVAIYLGNGKMIESPRPGKSIGVTNVYEAPTHIRRWGIS